MTTASKKSCYRCRTSKRLSGFTQRRDGRFYDMCRTCVREILSRRPCSTRTRLQHSQTHRTCYLCTRSLPNSQFTRRTTGTYFSACRDCNRLVFAQRRRARLLAAEGEFTKAEWEALLAKFDACPDCRVPWEKIRILPGHKSAITVDHVLPLSKGGSNRIDNIRPLCYSCNSRKGDR